MPTSGETTEAQTTQPLTTSEAFTDNWLTDISEIVIMGEVRIAENLPLSGSPEGYLNESMQNDLSRYDLSGGDYSKATCTFALLNSEMRILKSSVHNNLLPLCPIFYIIKSSFFFPEKSHVNF